MRWTRFSCALALVAMASVVRSADAAPPSRIMSLNLCADQLLLALLPPERIVSLTWLSRSEGDPALLPLALRIPVNHGTAEEVLAARPDLVVAGRYTTSATRAMLRRVGVPVLEIDPASDWEGIRTVTRTVAAAVGAQARAEELLATMDAELAQLRARRVDAPLRVIGWGGSGDDVPGRDTLFNAILEAAGAVNIAAQDVGVRSYDLEQVLRADADVLMRGAAYSGTPALRNVAATHPVLRRHAARMITYPEGVYGCGVPRASAMAVQLAATLDQVRIAQRSSDATR
jgi:iron complex transport system substrate-binding protein